MTHRAIRRWALRVSVAAAASATLAAGAQAAAIAAPAGHGPAANPYSPAYRHPYRHGAVPTLGAAAHMRRWAAQHPGAAARAGVLNLRYGGAVDGIGVTSGHPRVYLVFYGSQWGTKGTNANGDVTLSGDPSKEAPYLQEFYKGVGVNKEKWSGVMTQYCQGVAAGAQTCPATAQHVAYPRGGALAGVWVDESSASPSQATGHQLGVEAVHAAAHFGNTTATANRNAQYVIVSPHGTHPDGFNTPSGNFCAWHDYNGDTTLSGGAVSSPYGDIAFTNSPYITDMGASCGQGFVNAGGTLDGVSIVNGHEYAETITDQNPPGGWTDSSGDENGDKCAWIPAGNSGGSFDLALATGTFAVQTTWANDGSGGSGACEGSHSIVSTQLLKNPGFESGSISPWAATAGVLQPKSGTYAAHSGSWLAKLDGAVAPHTDTLSQTVTIPATYSSAAVLFWLKTQTNDPTDKAYDTLTVEVLNSSGTVLKTLATYSNLDATSGYQQKSFPMAPFIGKKITIKFIGKQTLAGHNTAFLVDDGALNVY